MHLQIISHQLIFVPEAAGFKQCHASTVVLLPDGEIACAWFGGDHEKAPNVCIWFSRRDSAGIWSAPVKAADGCGTPCWNPVLFFHDGSLMLFYKLGGEIPCWRTMVRRSADRGRTWDAARELVPGDTGGRGPVKNKCILLADGSLLAPASTEDGGWNCFADRSCDGGTVWHRSANVPLDRSRLTGSGIIQPTLWQDDSGIVHMLARSSEGFLFRSDSEDGGMHWSEAAATSLPNNNSGVDLTRLSDGRLVLAFNPVSGNWAPRSPIALAVSGDNGSSWSEPLVLEHVCCDRNQPDSEFSYPAIVSRQTEIFLTYTWKRQSIAFWHLRL